jgi:hypothetical protein
MLVGHLGMVHHLFCPTKLGRYSLLVQDKESLKKMRNMIRYTSYHLNALQSSVQCTLGTMQTATILPIDLVNHLMRNGQMDRLDASILIGHV